MDCARSILGYGAAFSPDADPCTCSFFVLEEDDDDDSIVIAANVLFLDSLTLTRVDYE